MKKLFFTFVLLSGVFSFAQKNETFSTANYSINVPDGWKTTNDSDIINIFPSGEIGAITISEYHDLPLPKEEVKKFVLALYKSSDEESKVKSISGKKGYTEYYYEYLNGNDNIFWVTKVFQKDKDLYLITINCNQKYWNGSYMMHFQEAFNSFKIKK